MEMPVSTPTKTLVNTFAKAPSPIEVKNASIPCSIKTPSPTMIALTMSFFASYQTCSCVKFSGGNKTNLIALKKENIPSQIGRAHV